MRALAPILFAAATALAASAHAAAPRSTCEALMQVPAARLGEASVVITSAVAQPAATGAPGAPSTSRSSPASATRIWLRLGCVGLLLLRAFSTLAALSALACSIRVTASLAAALGGGASESEVTDIVDARDGAGLLSRRFTSKRAATSGLGARSRSRSELPPPPSERLPGTRWGVCGCGCG